jgi:predicted nucleic acid-binding Zn ribbon protein
VYDYKAKLCWQQAEVIQNLEDEHVHSIRKAKARLGKYMRLDLDCGYLMSVQVTNLPL